MQMIERALVVIPFASLPVQTRKEMEPEQTKSSIEDVGLVIEPEVFVRTKSLYWPYQLSGNSIVPAKTNPIGDPGGKSNPTHRATPEGGGSKVTSVPQGNPVSINLPHKTTSKVPGFSSEIGLT
jgi:hypothetical protein